MSALKVFYSYSHRDERHRETLETHLSLLEREGLIAPWHDRKVSAGSEWKGEINQHLELANIILLLISADFLASNYCYDIEMARALERHDAGEAKVIPLIVRPVDWLSAPFAKLQALPSGGRPVVSWPVPDEAWANIAEGIRISVREVLSGKVQPPARQRLILRARASATELHCVFGAEADMGRSPACDFSFTHAPSSVGNFHAKLLFRTRQNTYLIQDMASLNGTYVNNRRVDIQEILTLGATVDLGRALRFTFRGHDAGNQHAGSLIFHDSRGRALAYYVIAPGGELRIGNGAMDFASFPGFEPDVSIGTISAKSDGLYYLPSTTARGLEQPERLHDGDELALGPLAVKVNVRQ